MNRTAFGTALVLLMALAVAGCGGDSSKSASQANQPTLSPATSTSSTTSTSTTTTTNTTPTATAGRSIPHGVSHGTMEFDGLERTYRLFVPSTISGDSHAALVVGLHGGLGSGDQFADASNFETLAESEGFIVVFPDGADRTWNAGTCCGQSVKKNTDDVGFLAALILKMKAELPVDPAKVFMTGHSNGAMMAFRFGCERADMVKAIAPVAGSLEIPDCKPSQGVSLLAIHGDADQNHPIDGGIGSRSIAAVSYRSMKDTLAMWTAAMKCASAPAPLTAGALTTTVWSKCLDGTQSTYTIVAGADHPWPGGKAGTALAGTPSKALDATLAVWTFFKTLP